MTVLVCFVSPTLGNPECAMRFLDLNTLIAKGGLLEDDTTDIVEREEEQRLFLNVTFGCTGTINKWLFAAEDKGGGVVYPEAQLWDRLLSSDLFTKNQESSLRLTRTDSLNVYQFLPTFPIRFNPGQILGLHQPSATESAFMVYSQTDAGGVNLRNLNEEEPLDSFNGYTSSFQTSQRDLPLIAVEISKFLKGNVLFNRFW